MRTIAILSRKKAPHYRRAAIVALSATMLSACGVSNDLFQGDDILVEARHEVLERDVYNVSDDHRELKDRFDALERLYVELVQGMKVQERKMVQLEEHVSKVQSDPKVASTMLQISKDMVGVKQMMKKLENRMYSVEVSEQTGIIAREVSPTNSVAPTGTSTNGAATETSTPKGTPVSNDASSSPEVFFGVHLASYRSTDQVNSGWAGLEQSFGDDLEGLTPLIYTQSQEGIGTFLRLIAGPLVTEQEAISLCSRIRQAADEQYCRVSEYQGDPIG